MKISYNWLKEYLPVTLSPEKVAELLTDSGLEVEGSTPFQSIKGGLEGLVIGKVLTKEKHPDADRLNLTTVDVGGDTPLKIVCGAPNVAVNQKVVVAGIGVTIFPLEGSSLKMKKAKIRGQESEGMICAEDEIGLGKGHDGIMVLSNNAPTGQQAKEYFEVENDVIFEIGLTPNRADGMSHYGVARDLRAMLLSHNLEVVELQKPTISDFKSDNNDLPIAVEVENSAACPRYVGVTLTNITVADSPKWLQNRLKSIGLSPINNIVDITNFVLHEIGQPLHAFDAAKIEEKKVIVKNVTEQTKFKTLDETERVLSNKDLMICNAQQPMCIAGVFGGLNSGVSDATTSIFLESAYFNPVTIRKTAKRHGLNTDASFRFERGIDPAITVEAVKRAALLMKEIAGATISSEIIDIYPAPISNFEVTFSYSNCNKVIGQTIPTEKIKAILKSLDIEIKAEKEGVLSLEVPAYRTDVQREIDVIEEVLRIYGYNNIEMPANVISSLSYAPKPDVEKVQNIISDLLSNNGYFEMMNNSLTKDAYYNSDDVVKMLNPLSSETNVMRQNLLYGGLESFAGNINHKQAAIKGYEFGNIYFKKEDKYIQNRQLILLVTGNENPKNWKEEMQESSLFTIKKSVEGIINRLGITGPGVISKETENPLFAYGLSYSIAKNEVVELGAVGTEVLTKFGIKQTVFYAVFNWDKIISLLKMNKTVYQPVSKFPKVKRDLSLLIDASIEFKTLQAVAKKAERKLLKEVSLFDVYQGKNIAKDKKSYAMGFVLADDNKTLSDKEIDKVMRKIQQALEKETGAELR